ncbi:hypothetical protein B0T18DRAFT_86736 [Schizothecium vesticola]|uniref:Uncharacterized protein n=1 Tax=Schizothecium vesticola TaxID=314040 RepID=A0AA40KAP4_9PEZI|nr:hypothetical protein B0T18DRAFT_86736 [Schizothecium vesticola]
MSPTATQANNDLFDEASEYCFQPLSQAPDRRAIAARRRGPRSVASLPFAVLLLLPSPSNSLRQTDDLQRGRREAGRTSTFVVVVQVDARDQRWRFVEGRAAPSANHWFRRHPSALSSLAESRTLVGHAAGKRQKMRGAGRQTRRCVASEADLALCGDCPLSPCLTRAQLGDEWAGCVGGERGRVCGRAPLFRCRATTMSSKTHRDGEASLGRALPGDIRQGRSWRAPFRGIFHVMHVDLGPAVDQDIMGCWTRRERDTHRFIQPGCDLGRYRGRNRRRESGRIHNGNLTRCCRLVSHASGRVPSSRGHGINESEAGGWRLGSGEGIYW